MPMKSVAIRENEDLKKYKIISYYVLDRVPKGLEIGKKTGYLLWPDIRPDTGY